jgi:hypothetical protein
MNVREEREFTLFGCEKTQFAPYLCREILVKSVGYVDRSRSLQDISPQIILDEWDRFTAIARRWRHHPKYYFGSGIKHTRCRLGEPRAELVNLPSEPSTNGSIHAELNLMKTLFSASPPTILYLRRPHQAFLLGLSRVYDGGEQYPRHQIQVHGLPAPEMGFFMAFSRITVSTISGNCDPNDEKYLADVCMEVSGLLPFPWNTAAGIGAVFRNIGRFKLG